MKKVIVLAIASNVAFAGGSYVLEDLTTRDLEERTKDFIESNNITPYHRRKLNEARYSTRSQRLHRGSKSGKSNKGSSSAGGKSGKSDGNPLFDDDFERPGSDVSRRSHNISAIAKY